MDRQFYFRSLLLKIYNRLSKDDQHRFHFLVGDHIPRVQREDVTLPGTLAVFELLIDRALLNEDELDFLIQIFLQLRCYEAVKLLREYQNSKGLPPPPSSSLPPPPPPPPATSSNERKITVSDVFNDNEDDKYSSTPYETLLSQDSTNPPLPNSKLSNKATPELIFNAIERPDTRKMTTTETLSMASEVPDIIDQPSTIPPLNINSTEKQKKSFKIRLIHILYIIFSLHILVLLIYLCMFLSKKMPAHIVENKYRQDVYVIKRGKLPDKIQGTSFDHSIGCSLTYNDRLRQIDTDVNLNDIYSIKFIYSQNKSIKHVLRNNIQSKKLNSKSIYLENQPVRGIEHCYNETTKSSHFVGISFDNLFEVIGICSGQTSFKDKYPDHIFGYALGKQTKDQYLTGFQFIWYKICSYNSRVTSCL